MKPVDYQRALERARDSQFGVRLLILNGRQVSAIRRRLYHARDRARANGDSSFNSLATVIQYPVTDGRPAVELWIVRNDRIGSCSAMEDGMRTETSELAAGDLTPGLLARGFQPKPSS